LTDQSGSSATGLEAPHPLVQSGVVAFEFLDPPVDLCVGKVDGSPGFSESCLHLLFKTVESLFDVGDAVGNLADLIPHSFNNNGGRCFLVIGDVVIGDVIGDVGSKTLYRSD